MRALIEYNLFDSNRHSIAATGVPGTVYEARHNVELGVSFSHCFDVHGGRARGDGTDIAGSRVKIYNNTFRSPARAVAIRGVPQEKADINNNWFYHDSPGPVVISPWPVGGDTRVNLHNNAYGADMPELYDMFDAYIYIARSR